MQTNLIPFNIDLLTPTKESLKFFRPVTSMNIFEGSSKNFHPDGLFSLEIFGKIGDDVRMRKFSYIDLGLPIFHPLLYKTITDIKSLYGEILSGKGYAIWSPETSTFEPSNPVEGRTGYRFFLEHFPDLQFPVRESNRTQSYVQLIDKYRDHATLRYWVVLPAGLRDFEIDSSGRPTTDDVNNLYKKVIALSQYVKNVQSQSDSDALDNVSYHLQIAINDIYNYYKAMIEGKGKLILGKWASRKIFNGTRNVITSLINDIAEVGNPRVVGFNQTSCGLYQYLKATLPVAIYKLKNGFLSRVFNGNNAPAILVNQKTLVSESVNIAPEYYDAWMTTEGLEKIIHRFGEEALRHIPIEIHGHWLGLIYRSPNSPGTYRLFQSIDDMPPDYRASYQETVKPITMFELLYISVYEDSHTYPGFVTRYPISGYGSIYPSLIHLRSTVREETREALDDQWQASGIVSHNFPIRDEGSFNSFSPHNSHLARLGGDGFQSTKH